MLNEENLKEWQLERASREPLDEEGMRSGRWLPQKVSLMDAAQVGDTPVNWIIEDLLVSGRAANLCGLGGSSKSSLLVMWSIQVVLGIKLLGWNVGRKGSAVLLLAEDTVEDVQRMFSAFVTELNLTEDQKRELYRGLHIHAAAGSEFRLVDVKDKDWTEQMMEEFIEYCNGYEDIALIGLDPALALTNGRELDEIDQRYLAYVVDRIAICTDAAVVLISHASKSAQYQKDVGSHMSRGSASLVDALRLEMYMRKMTSAEAKKYGLKTDERHKYVCFQVTKANKLPPEKQYPRWFERRSGGVLCNAVLSVKSKAANKKSLDLKLRESGALMMLLEVDKSSGGHFVVHKRYGTWRDECVQMNIVEGLNEAARDTAARRILKKLIEFGYAVQPSKGVVAATQKGLEFVVMHSSGVSAEEVDGGDEDEE